MGISAELSNTNFLSCAAALGSMQNGYRPRIRPDTVADCFSRHNNRHPLLHERLLSDLVDNKGREIVITLENNFPHFFFLFFQPPILLQ